MAKLFSLPKQVVLTNTGALIPGAKAYFYEAGTSTLLNVYTDAALATPHANPVIADASGRFPAIYYDQADDYKFVVTSASDVELYSQDDVATATNASTIALADVGGNYAATDVEAAFVELASTSAGEGASIIGIEDSGALYAAGDVEAALAEVMADVDTAEATIAALPTSETKYKTALQSVAASTTLIDDDHLTAFALTDGKLYKVEGYLQYVQNVGNIKFFWTFSAAPPVSGRGSCTYLASDSAGTTASVTAENIYTDEAVITTITDGTENNGLIIRGIFNCNGGTVGLRWAQETSSANSTIVGAGSYVTITELGDE